MKELYSGPFGLVSDAHGNPMGLRAAVDLLYRRGAKTIFFLGDAVGYMPLEREVMRFLSDNRAVCISGNHEAMLLNRLPRHADEVCRLAAAEARLSANQLEDLASWPERRVIADERSPDRTMLLVHGSPNDPLQEYVQPNADLGFVDHLNVAAMACGHTHRPFVARRGTKLVTNCGSVGLPRDNGGSASCAFLDLATLSCEILRARFDVQGLLSVCEQVELPHPSVVTALRRGADESEMVE